MFNTVQRVYTGVSRPANGWLHRVVKRVREICQERGKITVVLRFDVLFSVRFADFFCFQSNSTFIDKPSSSRWSSFYFQTKMPLNDPRMRYFFFETLDNQQFYEIRRTVRKIGDYPPVCDRIVIIANFSYRAVSVLRFSQRLSLSASIEKKNRWNANWHAKSLSRDTEHRKIAVWLGHTVPAWTENA